MCVGHEVAEGSGGWKWKLRVVRAGRDGARQTFAGHHDDFTACILRHLYFDQDWEHCRSLLSDVIDMYRLCTRARPETQLRPISVRDEGNKAAVWAPSFAAVADLNLTKRWCYFNYCILVSQCILKPVFSPHTGLIILAVKTVVIHARGQSLTAVWTSSSAQRCGLSKIQNKIMMPSPQACQKKKKDVWLRVVLITYRLHPSWCLSIYLFSCLL